MTSTHACSDCGVPTWPFESFMTSNEIWVEGGDVAGRLCVGCLEERLGRVLTPEDFPPLPANDDDECDSVRLRTRKGSGRRVAALYQLGATAVLELGVDSTNVAEVLGIDGRLLELHVDSAKFNRAVLAEIDPDESEAARTRRLAVGMADGLMRGDHE